VYVVDIVSKVGPDEGGRKAVAGMTLASGRLDRSRDAGGMTAASRPGALGFAVGGTGRFAQSSRQHPARRLS